MEFHAGDGYLVDEPEKLLESSGQLLSEGERQLDQARQLLHNTYEFFSVIHASRIGKYPDRLEHTTTFSAIMKNPQLTRKMSMESRFFGLSALDTRYKMEEKTSASERSFGLMEINLSEFKEREALRQTNSSFYYITLIRYMNASLLSDQIDRATNCLPEIYDLLQIDIAASDAKSNFKI